ncbi:SDR family NAD(P)-dependent oxidoreductase, partial [Brevibacillus laterosporus]|nr:SDR family NAD(P)-dependent oxidoreductase [Brevibacillus laterosporus]
MLTPLKDKTVVVTGASKGIGKGIARTFAAQGAKVAVVARSLTKAEETAVEIRKNGGIAHAFQGNVADLESMKCVASETAGTFGGIDVLCANAGIFPNVPIEEMTG